jgi:hypothetical protein
MTRVMKLPLLALIAGLALLAGCNKESADSSADARPPIAMPTTQDDGAWRQYVGQMVSRHVKIKRGVPPFAVYISPDEDPAPTIANANQTLQRGVIKDTIVAFGSRDSALMASKMSEVFADVPENRLKGARVVFVGKSEDRAVAEASIGTTGAEFIFLEFGS